MKYIFFIILVILLFITYYLSQRIAVLNDSYNKLLDKHAKIFALIRKRDEYLLKLDENLNLDDIYNITDTSRKLDAELNYSNDIYLMDEIYAAIDEYNHEVDNFNLIKDKYKIIYGALSYIDYDKYQVKK